MPDAKSIIGYNDSEAAHKRRVKEGKEAMLMTAPIAKTSFDWTTFSKKLPIGEDDGSEALRRKLWGVFDLNGNGMVSLAEFDRGLQAVFATKESLSILDVLFRAKPAIARAFHAARASDQSKGEIKRAESNVLNQRAGLNTDQYVSYPEFRALLHFFRQYLELWLMFEAVDTDGLNYTSGNKITEIGRSLGDKKISIEEFRRAVPLIETWGSTDGREPMKIADPDQEFEKIDADMSGAIRFDEFAAWCVPFCLQPACATPAHGPCITCPADAPLVPRWCPALHSGCLLSARYAYAHTTRSTYL